MIAAQRKYRRIREELERVRGGCPVRREKRGGSLRDQHFGLIYHTHFPVSKKKQASWGAAGGGHDRGRSRFVHKLSAWQQGGSHKDKDKDKEGGSKAGGSPQKKEEGGTATRRSGRK